jgi:hypothetical protein
MTTEAPKPTNEEQASVITDELPVCEEDSDLISLCDIVVTGIEHEEWTHFWIHKYDPKADGVKKAWAVLRPLPSAGEFKPNGERIQSVVLYARDVRRAVYDYLLSRLNGGMDPAGARQLVDGSYTDTVVADSILQFALYGEEVY